jgi:hypothetical protein
VTTGATFTVRFQALDVPYGAHIINAKNFSVQSDFWLRRLKTS